MEPSEQDHTKRDSETFMIIGGFIVALAVPVGLGHFWEWESAHAQTVNLIATVALAVIGGGMVWFGFKLRKRSRNKQS
ncbi:MAG: hypothetical protein AMXMBFR4_05880 [Candidatus Hydrogenedentota bacterium]